MTTKYRTAHDFASGEIPSAAVFDGLPGGQIMQDDLAADAAAIGGSETAFSSGTPDVNPSRKVRARITLLYESSVVGDQFGIYLRENGTLIRRFLLVTVEAGAAGAEAQTWEYDWNGASGTPTITVGVLRTSGTGTLTPLAGTQVTLSDVGPSTV